MKAKIFHYNVVESLNSSEDKEKNEIPIDNVIVIRFDDEHPDIEISMDRVRNIVEVRTVEGVLIVRPWVSNRILVESNRKSI